MLDFCLLLMEYEYDLDTIEFFIDLFPEEVHESNIRNYFNSFKFSSSEQVIELKMKAEEIIKISKRLKAIPGKQEPHYHGVE